MPPHRATTCGNWRDFARTRITYLQGESRRVRIMSFNPRVPRYEGENPCGTILFRRVVGAAVPHWQLDPVASRVVGALEPAKHPFEDYRKILITHRGAKEISTLHIDLEGITCRIKLRNESGFRVRSKMLDLVHSKGVTRIMHRSKKLSSHVGCAFFFIVGKMMALVCDNGKYDFHRNGKIRFFSKEFIEINYFIKE